MHNDKKIIRTTLIILFLSLFVIYTFYFQQKEADTTESTTQEIITYTGDITSGSDEDYTYTIDTTGDSSENSGTNIYTGIDENDILQPGFATGEQETGYAITTEQEGSGERIDAGFEEILENLPKLSGTTEYFGDMQMVQILGLTPEYTLTDSTGIYYAYMKDIQDSELKSIVQKLSGDIYTLRTELDIQQNDLYGDEISFINIPGVTFTQKPTIQRKIVFIVMKTGQDTRFIEMPITIYYKSKPYLKELFRASYE